MKPVMTLFLLLAMAILGCKPRGPLVEPKDTANTAVISTASPASATLATRSTTD